VQQDQRGGDGGGSRDEGRRVPSTRGHGQEGASEGRKDGTLIGTICMTVWLSKQELCNFIQLFFCLAPLF